MKKICTPHINFRGGRDLDDKNTKKFIDSNTEKTEKFFSAGSGFNGKVPLPEFDLKRVLQINRRI